MLRWLLLALFVLPLCSVVRAAPPQERCVVLVSVDGLAGFYLDDPRAELPTLRRLAREGARATGLVCSFPTVTWPNHTTLVTGVPPAMHGVVGNNYIDRATGKPVPLIVDPLFDKHEIVLVPTVYDVAHRASLKTAAICWPATRNADTLDLTAPDMPDDAWMRYGTRSWLAELQEAGIPVDRHGDWVRAAGGGVQRDSIATVHEPTKRTGQSAMPTTGSATWSRRSSVRRWPPTPRCSCAATTGSFPSRRISARMCC
jgi:hypothetical protein